MSNIRAINYIDQATGLPFGLTNISGRPWMSNVDLTREIVLGTIAGSGDFQFFGTNPAVGLGSYETLWNAGGLYYYLPSPQILKISSTSSNDTSVGGSGARRLQVNGLAGTGWLYTTENVDLTGTTAASTTNEFIRVWEALVIHTGSNNTNEGTIYIRDNANTNTVAQININEGVSSQAVWSVPGNASGYLEVQTVAVASGKVAEGRIMLKYNILALYGLNPMRWIGDKFPIDSSVGQRLFIPPLNLLPRTDFEVRAVASAANTSISSYASFWYL